MFCAFCCSPLQAEQQYFVLSHKLPEGLELESAFFVVNHGERIRRYSATIFSGFEINGESGAERLTAAVRIPANRVGSQLEYSLVAARKDGALAFFPIEQVALPLPDYLLRGADGIRSKLLAVKENLKSWEAQVEIQRQSLERLRSDAEVIGNLQRLSEVRQNITDLRSLQTKAAATIDHLKTSINNIKRHTRKPAGFARRQAQLTKQVAELAEAAKSAESGEASRRNYQERKLKRDLELIELARFENPDMLRARLQQLRAKRQELEQKMESSRQAQG
jgi:hypothetical protein